MLRTMTCTGSKLGSSLDFQPLGYPKTVANLACFLKSFETVVADTCPRIFQPWLRNRCKEELGLASEEDSALCFEPMEIPDKPSFSKVRADCVPRTLIALLRQRTLEQPDRVAFRLLGNGETELGAFTHVTLDTRARAIGAWLASFAK